MQARFDFIPGFCPNCGKAINLTGASLDDYYNGVSFTCDCGLAFQKGAFQKVHYYPGSAASVTICGIRLSSYPVMSQDKTLVTCKNCKNKLDREAAYREKNMPPGGWA